MKHAAIAVAVILCSVALHAGQAAKPRDPYNGTWRLNVEKTKLMSGGESPVSELTTFTIGADDVQHVRVHNQTQPNGPITITDYATKYNDTNWVSYSNPTTGRGTLFIMTIKVDDRTHYRLAKDPQGRAQYVLMRRMSEDHQSFQLYLMTTEGTLTSLRYFDRVE